MFVSILIHEITLKNVLIYKKKVLREKYLNRESKSISSSFSYIDVINTKLLAVVTLPYISHVSTED